MVSGVQFPPWPPAFLAVAQALQQHLSQAQMRIRILQKPPDTYGIDADSLLVGRVYDVASELGSALLLDGHAELYDTLTPAQKRERSEQASHVAWTAEDRHKRWPVSNRRRKNTETGTD
jgi:hypothetical protein